MWIKWEEYRIELKIILVKNTEKRGVKESKTNKTGQQGKNKKTRDMKKQKKRKKVLKRDKDE